MYLFIDRCNKLFRSNEEVEFHAAKTGHSQFSESTDEKKPLTEEEKKEQLRKISFREEKYYSLRKGPDKESKTKLSKINWHENRNSAMPHLLR